MSIRLIQGTRKLGIMAVPPPYRGMLALLSDPDYTTASVWTELRQVFNTPEGLPLGEQVFPTSYNSNLPEQISLENYPPLRQAPIEGIHTWGDYVNSLGPHFDRNEALRVMQLLESWGLSPRIWVDHRRFAGNLFYNPLVELKPRWVDPSGLAHTNQLYTLDLAYQLGVRYFWNGELAGRRLVQDAPDRDTWHYWRTTGSRPKGLALAALHRLGGPLWRWAQAKRFDFRPQRMAVLQPFLLPEGNLAYTFSRAGEGRLADSYGLAEQLSEDRLLELQAAQGLSLLYTNLGKPNAQAPRSGDAVPQRTRQRLNRLLELHRQGAVRVLTALQLLDYVVLRDNLRLDPHRLILHLCEDDIRFEQLTLADLADHTFGLLSTQGDLDKRLQVKLGDSVLKLDRDYYLTPHGKAWRLGFAAPASQGAQVAG